MRVLTQDNVQLEMPERFVQDSEVLVDAPEGLVPIPWSSEHVQVIIDESYDQQTTENLLVIAHLVDYLAMKNTLDVVCQHVARRIQGMTREQLAALRLVK